MDIPPDHYGTFDIIFSPVGTSVYTDTILISSNDQDISEKSITLLGKGIVVMPADSGAFYSITASDSCQLLTIDPSSGEVHFSGRR